MFLKTLRHYFKELYVNILDMMISGRTIKCKYIMPDGILFLTHMSPGASWDPYLIKH